MTDGMVSYAKQDTTYVLKFTGNIRYTMSFSLDKFLDRLFARKDFDTILIDLTETTAIDSTNLGLLARIANFMRERFGKKVSVFSTNTDVNQTLDSMGFYQIFDICDDFASCEEATEPMPVSDASEAELTRTLYEAHKRLCDLNEKNRKMFKSVMEALKSEL